MLTYGEKGLIRFLEDLFSLILVMDKTDAFNYYFALKQIFNKFDLYKKDTPGVFMYEDEVETLAKHKQCNKFLEQQLYYSVIQTEKILLGHQTRFVEDKISSSVWMMPNGWKKNFGSIRKSP